MKKLLLVGLFLAVALSFIPLLSHAQGGLVPCGFDTNDDGQVRNIDLNGDGKIQTGIDHIETCQLCHGFQLVNNILNWVLFVLIPIIAPIFIVIGGIMMLVAGGTPVQIFEQTGSQGNPRLYNQAKAVITAVVVGLIIVYTAYVVLSTILTSLGVADWTGLGSWWQISCN